MSIITLTTDFGTADGYVGAMKGMILGINPHARMIDLSHHVVPQAIRQAAYILSTVVPYFPAGTVHLAVVDPGVGSARRPIAIQTPAALFVGPDNGLFSLVLREHPVSVVHLTDRRFWHPGVSRTFHGRDIFAPVAAHLSLGVTITELGALIDDPLILPILQPERHADGSLTGHVLHVDRFGNLITDIPAELLVPDASTDAGGAGKLDFPAGGATHGPGPDLIVELAGQRIVGLQPAYASVAIGQPVALIGSSGLLEVAVRDGNAADTLAMRVGDTLLVRV